MIRVLALIGPYVIFHSVSLTPYSIFKRLSLGKLRPTTIFLQLANRYIKHPLGVFEVGDFYVPIDFVILDMAEDSRTQIILSRPFLATARCKTDVKEGKLTFDVGEHHAEFDLFKGCNSSLTTLPCCGCEVLDLDKPTSMLDMNPNDPSSFDCVLFKGSGLNGVTVDSLPSSIVKDEPCDVEEGYLIDYFRFITL